jgi:uncharacterized membrane protein YeaQ/YmgE (transglycosylase-associated protein family)
LGIIALIILGGLAGWVASMVMRSRSQGILGDVLLGVLGALVGGIIMNFFGNTGITGFNIYSLIVAIIGAVVLIGVGRLLYRS